MTDKKTLLILDDEPLVLDSLEAFFEDEGYTVFTAENGKQGLDIFFKENIDVVLTDLRMPVKGGFEVMAAIHAAKPDTPVLVVSGADEKKDVIRALRMGAKDYITKPVQDLEMVVHSVNRAFENYQLNKDNQQYRQALEKSEHQYRTITENIAEGVFTVDKDDNITYVNQAFCSISGYSKHELLAKTLRQISTKESFLTIQEQTLTQEKGKINRFDIQLLHKSMKPVHVELACNPIFSDTNQYQGCIIVARDITEMTELRKKFRKYISRTSIPASDVVSICASCKDIKRTEEKWIPIESHFSDIVFSHGICPECCEKLYPQFDFSELDK
ncbi:MAG: response regulator [Pseudomonadota bacterium]